MATTKIRDDQATQIVSLTTEVTGTLPVANGGTGAATLTGIVKGSGTSAFTAATAGTDYTTPSSTETQTNKRVTPRVTSVSNTTSWTIDSDSFDVAIDTGLTGAVTVNAPTGTPTDGQRLWISLTGTASRAITWNAAFEASTIALPTTTSSTARLDVGFIWNVATSKWRCVGWC